MGTASIVRRVRLCMRSDNLALWGGVPGLVGGRAAGNISPTTLNPCRYRACPPLLVPIPYRS
jgi:hypothetical protein